MKHKGLQVDRINDAPVEEPSQQKLKNLPLQKSVQQRRQGGNTVSKIMYLCEKEGWCKCAKERQKRINSGTQKERLV